MDFRFTLSHNPKQSVTSGIDLPDNSLGNNVGPEEDGGLPNIQGWEIGALPTVNLPGEGLIAATQTSRIYAIDYTFATGLGYTLNYTLEYNIGTSTSSRTLEFVVLDGADNVIISDVKSLGSGAGTLSSSSSFTAPSGSVKYGFRVQITNTAPNVGGSDFEIQNNVTGTVTSQAEPGLPTSLQITEPDGWKGCKLILERHDEFHSLIEHYEGGAGGAFIFYGNNGQENGGVDYLRHLEDVYGFDVQINILTEFSFDGIIYEEIFSGQVDISAKDEPVDNQMQAPIIREDFWSKFINRRATQIDLSSNVDLDGKPVDPALPVTVNMTSQAVREQYHGVSTSPGSTSENLAIIVEGTYYQVSYDDVTLDEIEEVFNLLQASNPVEPQGWLETKYAGTYSFEFQTVAHDYNPAYNFSSGQELGDYIRFYLNINGVETEFDLGDTFTSTLIDGGRVYNLTLNNQVLPAKSIIKVYGRAIADLTESSPGYFGEIRWNGPVIGATINHGGDFTVGNIECYARITADTIYPDTTAQGFLIHDLFYAVLQRMGLGQSPFYSEFLGSTLTNHRQYSDDGCGWMYVILKGLQIRQYSLTDKPFFISFNQIWEGIHPILCLGLSYEEMDDSPAGKVIRVEQMDHFFSEEVSVNISNVRDIHSYYDNERIFKTIKTGFKKWQSEDSSGIDDPQTKRSYATRFEKVGKDIPIESDFIAAGVAIEKTRRTTIEKSTDYKYDNDNFIISINSNDVSPDRYLPELNENFDQVAGLLNSSTRYNLILTPMRILLRWAKFLGGCIQPYSTSTYRFVSGEGNYNMLTDYSCTLGNQCQAIICDPLSERQDISLAEYNSVFGYLHLAQECEMTIPMTKAQYDVIKNNRKKSIGISQTDSNFTKFKIKKLVFNLIEGTATINAWPKTPFRIQVINDPIEMPDCEPEASECIGDDLRLTEDSEFRITEDGECRELELIN